MHAGQGRGAINENKTVLASKKKDGKGRGRARATSLLTHNTVLVTNLLRLISEINGYDSVTVTSQWKKKEEATKNRYGTTQNRYGSCHSLHSNTSF